MKRSILKVKKYFDLNYAVGNSFCSLNSSQKIFIFRASSKNQTQVSERVRQILYHYATHPMTEDNTQN